MKNKKYTMEQIKQFIIDYKESNIYSSKEWLLHTPIIGRKLYERVILENKKREFIEKNYYEALNGSEEIQDRFISQMAPILDEFYLNDEKQKHRKR